MLPNRAVTSPPGHVSFILLAEFMACNASVLVTLAVVYSSSLKRQLHEDRRVISSVHCFNSGP